MQYNIGFNLLMMFINFNSQVKSLPGIQEQIRLWCILLKHGVCQRLAMIILALFHHQSRLTSVRSCPSWDEDRNILQGNKPQQLPGS